jgi:hypothetical protein
MLLVCLCFNSFGTASTKALSVFSWIFFGCTIFFALIVMSYDNKMIRAAGGVVFFALALVMNILALAHGW